MAEQQELDGRDCISSLPDELLLITLSKLNIVDGARTTVLSTRWRRNLWTLSTPILRLDASDFMPSETKYPNVPMNIRFDRILDQTLARYTGDVIDELCISYVPCRFDPPKIGRHSLWLKVDSWVEFAKTKFVKTLDLSFQLFDEDDYDDDDYDYSPPPLKSLTSTTFFPLVALRLKYPPSLSEWLLESLLSSFPNLEDLSIIESPTCDSKFLSLVRFTGSSLKLKRLELIGLHIGEICLSAPNLVSFNYVSKHLINTHTTMLLSSVPLLAQLSYEESDYSEYSVTEMGPMPNLKILNITLGEAGDEALRLFFRFLLASPCLCKLSLNLEFISCPVIPDDQLTAMNQCLEELEIDGFNGFDNEVQLVICIARFSPLLKKIMIHPNLSENHHNVVTAVQSLQSRLPQLEFINIL